MKNKILKKSLSVFLSFLMVLSCLVTMIPEIALEAKAASAVSYPVTLNFNLHNCGDGGHIKIFYYPVNADGTLDKSNNNLYYLFMNSLQAYSSNTNQTFTAGDSGDNRPSGDAAKNTGNVPGWPYKIYIQTNRYADIQIKSITIGNKTVLSTPTQWSCQGRSREFVSGSSYDGVSTDWPEPKIVNITGNSTDVTLDLTENTDYSRTYYTREATFYDQYNRQFPAAGGATWGKTLVTGTGVVGVTTTTVSTGTGTSTGRISFAETVQKNLPVDSQNGRLVYRFYCAYGDAKSECTITVNCPKYKANYVNAAGRTVYSIPVGYYGSTYSSSATATANTQTAYDGTSHTVYSWPSQTFSITGPITINETYKTSTHTYDNWASAGDVNHSHACTVCGYSAEEGHNFSDWVSVDSANHKKTCQTATCGHVVTVPHSFSNWVSDGDGKNATHTKTCTDCGYAESTPHAWNDGVVTTEAKCATDGVKTYTCTDANCGATYTEPVSKTNAHVFGGNYINVDTDGNGTMESHRQYCVNGDSNCTAYKDTAHAYGKWTPLDETSHIRTCTVCQLSTAKETLDHSWDEGTVTTNPDCTTDGERTFTCTTCGGTKTAVESQTGHNWGDYVANADGVTHSRTCQAKGCGVTEKSALCSFNNYNKTQSAGCDTNEIRVYSCDHCSNLKTVEGGTDEGTRLGLAKATGHNWTDCTADGSSEGDSFYLLKAATCTSSARYYKRCDTCGAKSDIANYNQTAAIIGDATITADTVNVNFVFFSREPRLGHDFSAGVVTNDDRTHSFKCVRYAECGKTGVGNVEGDTVNCSTTCSSTVVAPTCTTVGYTAYSCDVCQNKWQADETPMAAHKWISTADEADLANFVIKSAADCDSKAVYYKNCSVCDQSAEAIDASQIFEFGSVRAHDWSEWVADGDVTLENKDTAEHTRYCQHTDCGVTETETHNWNGGVVTQDPTYDQAGIKTYTCTVCKATVEEEIEADSDLNAPAVSIKWGETVWNSILNTITFGRYVNYDIALEIDATDAETGVAKVEYLVSNEVITDIETATGWAEYDADNKLTISKANENNYVVYAKATDNAGNVSYAGTDGFVIDTTKPVITVTGEGTDNKYCEEVTISFADENLDLDTRAIGYWMNGAYMWTRAEDIVKDEPVLNTAGKYKVVVSDKAGNETSVELEVVAHDYTEKVLPEDANLATPADCTNAATYYKVCSNCGEVSTTETFTYGEANGHDELDPVEEDIVKADCENAGSYKLVVYCDVCGKAVSSTTQTIPAREHNMTDWVEVTPATCTEDGLKRKTCQNTDEADKYYKVCAYYKEDEIPALLHDLEKTDAKPASCGVAGNIEYWTCKTEDGCGKLYKDEAATQEIALADTVVDALEHTLKKKAAKPATCGVAGNIEYWFCSTEGGCGKLYADEDAAQAIDLADTVIPARSHDLEKTDKKPASCGVAGNIEYWTCKTEDGCGKLYADANAALAIEEAATVIPALSHNLEKTDAKSASCGVAGNTEYWTCKTEGGCGKAYADEDAAQAIDLADTVIPALTHTLVKTDAVAPDCENDGNIEYWTCKTEDGCGKLYADEDAITEITDTVDPKTGHRTQYVEAVGASCTDPGTREHYKCLNGCGCYFADYSATLKLDTIISEPALNHDFTGIWSFSVTSGQHQRKCARCDVWTELEACTFAEGYAPVTNEGDIHTHKALCECGNSKTEVCTTVKGETHKDPTCGDSKDYGWTDYSCEKCSNEWEGDIVYALHKLSLKEKNDGDCMTKGYIINECTNDGCDHEVTQELSYGTTHVGDPDALTRVTVINKKTATCASGGYTGDIVCECGDILRKGIATDPNPNDHFWGNPAVENGTCVTEGYQISICEDCGEKKTVSIGLNPNNHVNVISGQDVEPTCTEFGYKGATVCEDCGAVVKEGAPVSPLGHKLSPWMIITMPSEDGKTPGYAERYCLRCGGEEETRSDFYYDEIYYVVYHNDDGVRLTAPRYYIEGDYTLRPETNPTKNENAKYTYEFIGWDHSDDELNYVEKQMAVIAQYKATEKSYKVTFRDANNNIIPVEGIAGKDILYSEITKAYKGATPTKAATADCKYEFKGWNISCNYETGEATVTPEFESIPIKNDEKDDGGIFGWFIRWIMSILAKLGIKF